MAIKNSYSRTCITIIFLILTALLVCSIFSHFSSISKRKEQIADFHPIIRTVCKRTFYPSLCFNTLSHASKNSTTFRQILEITIVASDKSVTKTRTQVKHLLTYQDLILQQRILLQDCLEMLGQTIEELGQSLDYLFRSSSNVDSLYANLKTLLSASMTNQHTCLDGFSDLNRHSRDSNEHIRLEKQIRDSLVPVIRLISNCLSIVTYMERRNERTVNSRQMFAKMPQRRKFPARITSSDRVLMERKGKIVPNSTVATDGSGDHRSISEALKKAPKRSQNRFVIKIKAGVYNERVEISRENTNIMLIGDGMSKTIITGSRNFVDGFSTIDSATLTVVGDKFLARDLTILNTAGPHKYQAVAARVTSNSAFYRCNFSSYQDTLFAHSLRQLYRECTIQGTIDFIFGNAAAVFQNCLIMVRNPIHGQSNMITAQGRRDPNQNTGFSLQNCSIIAADDLNETKRRYTWTFLGRPWGNYSRTNVMKSYLGDLIHPQGWFKWDNYSTLDSVEYIEHMNYGPGSDTRHRVTWGGYRKNCSGEMAEHFTVGEFLRDEDSWFESTGFPVSIGF